MDKRLTGSMFVKLQEANVPETIAALEKVWKSRIAHRPFEYQFLDENYTALYRSEQSIAAVFTTFSVLAILLACLGLFALTAYAMVSRTKEIGIRKVLGATVPDILGLVSKDFIKLVFIAIIIGVPVSLLAVNKWLEGFSYRVDIAWWVVAVSSLLLLVIATTTVCLQAIKTAMTNPVKNLKNE